MLNKKVSLFGLAAVMAATSANAAYSDRAFKKEVLTGLDIISARVKVDVEPDEAPGEMGLEVYQTVDAVDAAGTRLFIPTAMYLRVGGGISLGFATARATFDGHDYEANQGYFSNVGVGWNLSSYVRGEIGVQNETLRFSDLSDYAANYHTVNTMLYFDFLRRYVQTGDITYRRRFVPFMGIGAGAGWYSFDGAGGADGFVIAAPRAEIGFNVMLNQVIGLDIAYQYQLMIGNGYGWNSPLGGVDGISNLIASFRVNF